MLYAEIIYNQRYKNKQHMACSMTVYILTVPAFFAAEALIFS